MAHEEIEEAEKAHDRRQQRAKTDEIAEEELRNDQRGSDQSDDVLAAHGESRSRMGLDAVARLQIQLDRRRQQAEDRIEGEEKR